MAQKPPTFGSLTKSKTAAEAMSVAKTAPAVARPQSTSRIQTSVRLEPAMWAALNDLATRKRVETGQRVTVHDLLIEGGRHVLEANGVKVAK